MKNLFLLIFFLMSVTSIFGQVGYEKGYFIDNSGQKTECFIRNVDGLQNPVEFTYKLTSDGVVRTETIQSVKEFAISRFSRFIRATVQIDLSGSLLGDISNEKKPLWTQEQLFLNVIVQGKATLYKYAKGSLTRFFYSVSDTTIHQLVYKEYLVEKDVIAENNTFRQQLWTNVRSPKTKMSAVGRIKYNQKELEQYFENFNTCFGDTINQFVLKPRKVLWNLKVVSGVDFTDMKIFSRFSNLDDFYNDNKTGYCFGLESEFILPFNRNKWAIFIEPMYQSFKSEKPNASVKYKNIEFPVGIRYYSFINQDLKLFINGIVNTHYSIDFHSNYTYTRWSNEQWITKSMDMSPSMSCAIGGGAEYKRLSLELRYSGDRGLLNEYLLWPTDYTRFTFLLGYKLFKN